MLDYLRKLNRTRYFYSQLFTDAGEFELRILKDIVPRGCVAIDVGANSGVYSFHMARFAGKVLAFEPNPNCHTKINRLGRKIELMPFALSDQNSRAVLTIPKLGDQLADGWATLEEKTVDAGQKIKVETRTLDSFDYSPGVIKIDVEGHEISVINGATATLERARPNLIVECEERHKSGVISELFSILRRLNYEGSFFYRKIHYPTENFSLGIHQDVSNLVLDEAVPRQKLDYVNNFVFVPKEKRESITRNWRQNG